MNYTTRLALVLASVAVVAMTAAAFADSGTLVAEKKDAPRVERRTLEGREKKMRGAHGTGFKRRMVTGEFKVQTDDGFATVRVDQGTVTAVGDDSLTLKRADGELVTVTVTDETAIGKDRERAELTDIKNGDQVRVVQVDDGDGFKVKRVMVRTPGAKGADGAEARKTGFAI